MVSLVDPILTASATPTAAPAINIKHTFDIDEARMPILRPCLAPGKASISDYLTTGTYLPRTCKGGLGGSDPPRWGVGGRGNAMLNQKI
eukprot:1177240-Prorocentrum_minimum.AAC.2